ncbi:erythrocyte membrane-associated malaria antigen-like [Phytophthora cinnamomi]|uniref:erythrocyte membrane-associated malaria antigen-like n=1 Tax=Phytophthora cinnamomi TaxID=4785 RepID=UPI00355A63E4|nr:erythrocyte membrane-associated malaria antigen-like [Phytophthora cinnamomi]
MANSNPVLEMVIDGTPMRLILTTDLDGVVVCEDANTPRREWLMTDSEFDNARKRLRYELHWVSPQVREHEVQVPALAFSGRIAVGFFKQDSQQMRMAAVAYYLGSLGANGFIGAGFVFHPGQSSVWEAVQEATTDYHGYMYHGHDRSEKRGAVHIDPSGVKLAETSVITEDFDRDNYIWSEPFVSLGDDSDGVTHAQGISFMIHEARFICSLRSDSGNEAVGSLASEASAQSVLLFGEFSSSWDVVVDFNVPCLELPKEFYDSLAGGIGLQLDSRLGLSEIAAPATALPDLLFSLSFNGPQITLPLQALVLPELSSSSLSSDVNSTKICIQRSGSMVQRGTAAYAAATTSAAEVARLQRLHGATGIPVYNMIDSPIIFGAMVLNALGSVVFDGVTKRTGVLKRMLNSPPDNASQQSAISCLQPPLCKGQQEYSRHWNTCQDPDCSQYYFHRLDEDTKECVIDSNWTVMLAVTITVFVIAELFFSLSLRSLVRQSQQRRQTISS